jgi:hypothetical protein
MSAIKGFNNFKKMQDKKVQENTSKIESSLNNLPESIKNVTFQKVIKLVANDTGLHFTTINKNKKYTEMCNTKYLTFLMKDFGNTIENSDPNSMVRLLKLENTNLKNQIIALKNVVKRLEEVEI